jgi:ribosomal protein L11 methyltransferase
MIEIGDFAIMGDWDTTEEPAKHIIRLIPSRAWGIGHHPSTRLILEALPRYVRTGTTFLDVGVGSGLVAIAAAKLGGYVTGYEVKPESVRSAKANAKASGVKIDIVSNRFKADALPGTRYDVIFVNIGHNTNEMANDILRCTLASTLITFEDADGLTIQRGESI